MCVCVRERERERVCVSHIRVHTQAPPPMESTLLKHRQNQSEYASGKRMYSRRVIAAPVADGVNAAEAEAQDGTPQGFMVEACGRGL